MMPSPLRLRHPSVTESVVLPPDPRGAAMDKFIRRENLVLFRKDLAETHDNAARKVILKLLAEEEAKDSTPPKVRKMNDAAAVDAS
jgi:hypothetical protein